MTNQSFDLEDDISHALDGWITNGHNVTAFDRLNTIKLGILEGRYGSAVTLKTLKTELQAKFTEFGNETVGGREFSLQWQSRIEGMIDSVDETIGFLKERQR